VALPFLALRSIEEFCAQSLSIASICHSRPPGYRVALGTIISSNIKNRARTTVHVTATVEVAISPVVALQYSYIVTANLYCFRIHGLVPILQPSYDNVAVILKLSEMDHDLTCAAVYSSYQLYLCVSSFDVCLVGTHIVRLESARLERSSQSAEGIVNSLW
jgi:hypothetical protein